jgi:hypothetical protein
MLDRPPWLSNTAQAVTESMVVAETAATVDTVVGYHGYVSPTGDNGNDGLTTSTPWQTLAYAIGQLSAGQKLGLLNGTFTDAIGTVKANMIVSAVNDGQVILGGAFSPGDAGFFMQGIRVVSSTQKSLGANNTYMRMSFVGGPACGNTVNSLIGANTAVYNSAFFGTGGRYLLLPFEVTGVTLANIILRPDGGWGEGDSSCTEFEPHAAFTLYDSTGFLGYRIVMIDAIGTAHSSSERLGGIGVNTHTAAGNVGVFGECIAVNSGAFGRFWSDGLGSHNVTFNDCESFGNNYEYGMTRNVLGTTTATRFDTDANTPVASFKGTTNRTTGSQLALPTDFLNDARWATEMQAIRAGGWGDSGLSLSAYVESFRP